MTKIRPIVKAAFRVDELVYQFDVIDVEDGLLDGDDTLAGVNEAYSDEYIIGEARNRLDIAGEWLDDKPDGEELKYRLKDHRQLTRFIEKWS